MTIIGTMAEACRKASRAGGDGSTRLIHTFDGPIVTQLAAHADALGGAEAVTVVSPFFGGPDAVRTLAAALGCGRIRVAVTGKAPEFFDFAAAKALGAPADPVRSDAFSSTALLHAKIIEVTCRHGRLVLSGSANATRPALVTSDNVEASVLRMVDDRLTFGWAPTDARDRSRVREATRTRRAAPASRRGSTGARSRAGCSVGQVRPGRGRPGSFQGRSTRPWHPYP